MNSIQFETMEMRPVSASCDASFLYVTLADYRQIRAPLWWYPYLAMATPQQRANTEIEFAGIWWPDIDGGVSVKALLLGWKAPGAREPIIEDLSHALYIGQTLSKEEENNFANGACCQLDYRSKLHEVIHRTYNGGRHEIKDFYYDKFFAATDTLLDVANILHMATVSEWPENEHLGQLWTYGVLQALVVQQQASRQLLKCFGYQKFLAQEGNFDEVNEYRISVAGHPSDHSFPKRKLKGSSFLGHRVFGSRTRFTFVTCEDFGKWHHREVDPLALIEFQRSAVELNFALVWKQIKDNPKYYENSSVENKR